MGLDSWLHKRAKTTSYQIIAELKGEPTIELMYWRKRFAIHDKFSSYKKGEQDNCVKIPLTKENLKEVLDWAKSILKDFENEEDDYTEKQDIEELKELLIKIIKETDFENEEIYYYAWY